jgi:hypothetical protein
MLTGQGPGWLRYQTDRPEEVNPSILHNLLQNGHPVVSLQEIPRNLEQVYLQAVNNGGEKGASDVN